MSKRTPIAGQLLTLTYHPGLDLVVVFIREGDGAGGSQSGSGAVVEMPRFHNTLHNTQGKRGAGDAGSATTPELQLL